MSPDESICPCEEPVHPRPLFNPPGRDTLLYRVGDFATFREALLRARPGEQELAGWRPSAQGDLALQLLEWWAYLADILTFYNERAAHDMYLRTATGPGAVERLVRVLGYRPRPGLAATGVLAALVSARTPLTLPRGFALQSKPGPGKPPEIFELDEDTPVEPSGSLAAELVRADGLENRKSVLLRGTGATLEAGEQVVLVARDWANLADKSRGWAVMNVQAVSREKDARGKSVTRLTFTQSLPNTLRPTASTPARVADFRVWKSGQTALRFSYGNVSTSTVVHLESVFRSIRPGDPVLFGSASNTSFKLVLVTKYEERVLYANDDDPTKPPSSASDPQPIPVPILHTVLTINPSTSSTDQVRFGWLTVGELVEEPPSSLQGTTAATLSLEAPLPLAPGTSSRLVLLEDSTGRGQLGRATPLAGKPASEVQVTELDSQTALKPPLRVLYNLLPVSRGATVLREVLGNGDGSRSHQEFVLQKGPLTWLREGAGQRSTLRLWVENIEWKEVPSFYGQPPDARIFVTREDEEHKTHVLFGDGVHGARLPTGLDNVVATYRQGSGGSAPDAGALSVLMQPRPGLQSVRNPVPVGGGADPAPSAKLREFAPRSVLTFGRAISAGDYEALALAAPSVNRVRAYWTFDEAQHPLLRLYVGDSQEAVNSVRDALRAASDPQRRVEVLPASYKDLLLSLEIQVDPRFVHEEVEKGVRRALLDPETGLFGLKLPRLGGTVYDSQIHEACLRVPGTLAVHKLLFSVWEVFETWPNHSPGEGNFFLLRDETLHLTLTEAAPHA